MPRWARAVAHSVARSSRRVWSCVRPAPAVGLLLAQPLVSVAGRYASRFSIRALEATVDAGVLGLGAALALVAAVLLAYIPRLPSPDRSGGLGLSGGSVRITPGTNRRLRIFATTQMACTFVLLAGAGMLVATLTALQTANTGYELRQVLAIDLPGILAPGVRDPTGEREKVLQEAIRRIGELPGVTAVAMGGSVPWRDRSATRLQFVAEGYQPANGEEAPTGRLRNVTHPVLRRSSASRFSRAGTLPTTTFAAKKPWPSSTRAWRSGCSRTATPSTGV